MLIYLFICTTAEVQYLGTKIKEHGLQFQVICLRCMLKLTVQHSVQKIKGGIDTANKGILHLISGNMGTTLLDC